MKCITVGFGNAGGELHYTHRSKDVEIAGVVELDPDKATSEADRKKVNDNVKRAADKGLPVFYGIEDAAKLNPDFWDICTPNKDHYSAIEQIIALDNNANILVEKPVCELEQIPSLEKLMAHFKGKLVVNENYKSSSVTAKVVEMIEKYGLTNFEVSVEFTKNRVQDVAGGRFLDKALGAFGYEGPHMITVVAGLGEGFVPNLIERSSLDDMVLPDGKIMNNQGTAYTFYTTQNNANVHFYTSMVGEVGIKIPQFNPPKSIPAEDTKTRYRVLKIKGPNEVTIAAQYEPIAGFNRSEGRVYVVDASGNVVEKHEPIADNTMAKHLAAAADYFSGKRKTILPALRKLPRL